MAAAGGGALEARPCVLCEFARCALNSVVVHYAHRLHEGVGGRRSDEPKAAALECLGHSLGFIRLREGAEGSLVKLLWSVRIQRFELPEEGREGAEFFLQSAGAPCVVKRRFDFTPMSDDSCISE